MGALRSLSSPDASKTEGRREKSGEYGQDKFYDTMEGHLILWMYFARNFSCSVLGNTFKVVAFAVDIFFSCLVPLVQ